VKNEKALKVLDYTAGFFLLICFAMLFSRWMQDTDFYPLWLIVLFFGLFLIVFLWYRKLNQKMNPPLPEALNSTPEEKEAERKVWQKKWEEDFQLEEEAHNLIVRLCESKNIALEIEQPGRSGGHYDIPEIWGMEKPIPLTPDELYAITANSVLHAVTKFHDDGIIYAHSFSRNGGWVSYR